jgi:alpha-amylase
MLQAFEWYIPADRRHWRRLRSALPSLKSIGVDNIWIPPGCKAMSPAGNGYDIYDLYDLGEFEQKGARATKWGDREDLRELLDRAEEVGVGVYWDAVLNHKAAADRSERCKAVTVDSTGSFWFCYRLVHPSDIDVDRLMGFESKQIGTR